MKTTRPNVYYRCWLGGLDIAPARARGGFQGRGSKRRYLHQRDPVDKQVNMVNVLPPSMDALCGPNGERTST